MDILEYYRDELNCIKNEYIKDTVKIMLSKAPAYYMEVDAASNKRYSRDRDGNIVKLRDHTKEVSRYLLLFMSHKLIRSQFSSDQRDYMLGATLVHDIFKRGINDEPTNYNLFSHPILVSKLLEVVDNIHSREIIRIAVAHNGPWTNNINGEEDLPPMTDNLQFYVHLSDWMASRNITWIDTSKESIGELNV